MSVDIYFDKFFTLKDVEEKTNLKVKIVNDNYWIVKSEDKKGLYVVPFNPKGDELNKFVNELTSYGSPEVDEILNELVLAFQTMFITDNEMEILWRMENPTEDDYYKMYKNTTERYGYIIDEQGKIIKK